MSAKMTVYKSLSDWLLEIFANPQNGFPSFYYVIDLEVLPDLLNSRDIQYQYSSLYSSPNDIQTPLCAGQVKHKDFKTFYVKRAFSEHDDRMGNEEFFEKLKRAITLKNLRGIMPQDGRKWRGISYEGGVYPSQRPEDGRIAIYQINLRLEYIE
jgi:hypothetical protein